MGMEEYIIACDCAEIDEKSKAAHALLFPNQPIPRIVHQKTLYRFIQEIPKSTQFYTYLDNNFLKNKGKFSYFFRVDNGDIVSQYNLLTGNKVVAGRNHA